MNFALTSGQQQIAVCQSKYVSMNTFEQTQKYSRPLHLQNQILSILKENQYLIKTFQQKLNLIPSNKIMRIANQLWQYQGTFVQRSKKAVDVDVDDGSNDKDNNDKGISTLSIRQSQTSSLAIMDGIGVMQFQDGGIYMGDWKNNQKSGSGVEIYHDKSRYQGFFQAGKANGYGIKRQFDGDKYWGYWKQGLKHGKGTQFYSLLNQQFQGQFQFGKKCGYGLYLYSSGDLFKGNWLDDKRHGPGIIVFYNGDIFKGNWLDDTIQGEGSIKYTNGDFFIGNYHKGMKQGKGTYFYHSGQKIIAEWKSDDDSIGQILYQNGDKYYGSIYKGERHGKGKMISFSESTVYEGYWRNGLRNGTGVLKSLTNSDSIDSTNSADRSGQILYAGVWSHDRYINKTYRQQNMLYPYQEGLKQSQQYQQKQVNNKTIRKGQKTQKLENNNINRNYVEIPGASNQKYYQTPLTTIKKEKMQANNYVNN